MGLRSARGRELYKKRMKEKGKLIAKEHWEQCRSRYGEDGMPFSMKLCGQQAFKEEFKGRSVLHRVWEMLAAEHAMLFSGRWEQALAQNVQNLKATVRALKAGGLWKGAWELTYLPDLHETECGVSTKENASLAKYLKEKAAMEKLLAEARKHAKKSGEM